MKEREFDIVKIGLNREREELFDRINRRVDQMVEAGMEEEARELYPLRYLNALNTVGYKEWFDFFDGKFDREEAIRLIKRNTRRYAKKQVFSGNTILKLRYFSFSIFNSPFSII